MIFGDFTVEERKQIYKIVYNHSDKEISSKDPFEEFGKDADVLDCFLYPDGFGYYLKYKPLKVFYQYVLRAKKLWKELNIPEDREFSVLDHYNENWLDLSFEIDKQQLIDILNNSTSPTFCFYKINNKYKVFVNKLNWESIEKSNNRNEAFDEIIELSKEEDNIVLVWSAIDSYEILSKKDSKERLKELGIKLEV